MPLGAHVSSLPKKQFISYGPKFLGEEDAFVSRFGDMRCTNCGSHTLVYVSCRVPMLAYLASTYNVLSFNAMYIEFRCSTC
jgi:hypothetical protein